MSKRYIKTVEWQDEHCLGSSYAYRQDGCTFVKVRVFGSVLLNGKEYLLDEEVTAEVEPSKILPSKG